jgi:predicted nucleic acid-binding Zn ribbon protein
MLINLNNSQQARLIKMPIYDGYHCDIAFNELLSRFSDKLICPICNQETQKLISTPAKNFEGIGIHVMKHNGKRIDL